VDLAERVLEGRSQGEYMRGFTSSVRRDPVGPVAQVAPWNYPMMMAVWKFAPALAAGNTVVLKPSDTAPATAAQDLRRRRRGGSSRRHLGGRAADPDDQDILFGPINNKNQLGHPRPATSTSRP
jgi:hypothetical protein